MAFLDRVLDVPNPSRVRLDQWMRRAADLPANSLVLDAGAGHGPYRELFRHCRYEAADFAQIDKPYTDLTYTCDLTMIPVENERFDRVVCNQVLEHVPEPTAVLRELRRVVRSGGGQLWLSAPLFYEEHEQPYDFFRYTRYGWERLAAEAGLTVVEIEWLEGYYATLSHQLGMAARALPRAHLPARIAFAAAAHLYARLELRSKLTVAGMPKNYAVVLARR